MNETQHHPAIATPGRLAVWRAQTIIKVLALLLLLPSRGQGQFLFVTNNGVLTITHYIGYGGEETIPDMTNGLPATGIAARAFQFSSFTHGAATPAQRRWRCKLESARSRERHFQHLRPGWE